MLLAVLGITLLRDRPLPEFGTLFGRVFAVAFVVCVLVFVRLGVPLWVAGFEFDVGCEAVFGLDVVG